MADKIQIISDGTVKGTKIKLDNTDMTSEYKVTSIYFTADGGSSYKSQYSNEIYNYPPNVNYNITYIDKENKQKTNSLSTISVNRTYSPIGNKVQDNMNYIGIDDDNRLKDKILDAFDKLRENHKDIPNRDTLKDRTALSLCDKYMDLVNEFETKSEK